MHFLVLIIAIIDKEVEHLDYKIDQFMATNFNHPTDKWQKRVKVLKNLIKHIRVLHEEQI